MPRISLKNYLFFILFIYGIIGCKVNTHLAQIDTSFTPINSDKMPVDSSLEKYLAPYRNEMMLEMDEKIGEIGISASKGKPESTLGNLVADIVKEAAEQETKLPIAFAIHNLGGIRIPTLTKGPISRGKIFELMPFDNVIVVLKMDGIGVQNFLSEIIISGGWPISNGIKIVGDHDALKSVEIQGENIDLNKIYYVAMPDFVANGGDKMDILTKYTQTNTGILTRDAIIKYFVEHSKNQIPILPKLESRIKL